MRDEILSESGNPPAPDTPMGKQNTPPHFFTQPEAARHWRLSGRTLERWRWTKQGPAHVKLGGRVVYPIKDVEAYEAQRRCLSAAA